MTTQGSAGSSEAGGRTEYDLIIIGGGPAGSTAAIYGARAGLATLVIDKGLMAGALGLTGRIANYPGIPGEVGGAELVQGMRTQAESFGARFLNDKVQGIQPAGEKKTVYANSGTYSAKALVIATGSMGRGQRAPGEERLLGRGVSYCATCDAAFFRGQEVAVAGNNDEAVEEALYMTRFAGRVHLLSPTPELNAPDQLKEEIASHAGVTVHPGAVLREVTGTDRVEGIRFSTREGLEQTLAVTGVFIYLQGGRPITDFLQGEIPTGDQGCLTVDREFQTGVPGVYAVGDVLCQHVKQAVVSAAEGAVAAMAAEKYLRRRKQIVVDWAKKV
jgi:thioredoxin reductase (NADPH)